jgi:hypothetical protein
MVNSQFISTSEWNSYINLCAQEVYGLVVQAFGNDYFAQNMGASGSGTGGYTFTTDGLNQFFALPSDFFKGLGVDLQITSPSQWVALKRFNFEDRNTLSLVNQTVPQAGQTLRVFYVPRFTPLVNDSDTYDGFNGWERYVIEGVVAMALGKEESDTTFPLQVLAMLEKRIETEAENRDAGSPATIADTLGRRARAMMYRFNGNNIWLIGNGTPGWGAWGDWGGFDQYGGWY